MLVEKFEHSMFVHEILHMFTRIFRASEHSAASRNRAARVSERFVAQAFVPVFRVAKSTEAIIPQKLENPADVAPEHPTPNQRASSSSRPRPPGAAPASRSTPADPPPRCEAPPSPWP